ncbi:cation transporter [Actinoalloteichus sp. AHMU CJ021]|uniref:cation diffusion facilitator family transporter n=1 Tax=Actinoalloteichus TaxID=65496 RepID=UPI00068DDF8C|nr:cation diffusion facilitator family transporter [Actinoalloteichus caeruleus]AUS81824.1 cation transporter [Actinoalloteichus sp. AHMU CJ021]
MTADNGGRSDEGHRGHGHGHGITAADAVSASGRHVRRMVAALCVLVTFLVVEVVVALATGSLALLSDAGHMLTDVLGIGMALAAITAARRAARRASGTRRTFGLYRLEVLAALANALLLFAVAGFILYEAAHRFTDPPEVEGGPVMIAAAAGLVANLVAFALLRQGAAESINVRGAYLEVLADTLASVGVLIGAAVTLLFGWRYADPLVAVAIAAFVIPRTARLAGQALRILVQEAPAEVDVRQLRRDLVGLPAVVGVHDLHVWTLTSGMEVLQAHLTIETDGDTGTVLGEAQRMLAEKYGIHHATLQVEPAHLPMSCRELSW